VVSLCASSSGCERNWCTFGFVSFFLICFLFLPNISASSYSFLLHCFSYFVDSHKEKDPVAA